MNNVRILHDTSFADDVFKEKYQGKNIQVFSANPPVKPCIGCFGCWIKTPGKCVIQDRCSILPGFIAGSDEMIVISEIYCGGYSPEVKAVMDRSIGYLMPFFRIVNSEMHHTMRYSNQYHFNVHFYGQNISNEEKNLAQNIVQANAVNMGALSCRAKFYDTAKDVLEVLK